MTLGITEVILTGFTSSMHYFSPRSKFKNFNSCLTVVRPFPIALVKS